MCEVISSQSSGVSSLLKDREERAGDGWADHMALDSQKRQHRTLSWAPTWASVNRGQCPGPAAG